jgi:pimeloyl-ACP methyl ester carboxylesterase
MKNRLHRTMLNMASEPPTPRKIVTYPLGGDPSAGAVFLFGDADAPNVALFCAGFPDDHENFLPFASRVASETKCLVGVTCLPGYDDRDDHPYTANKPDGYTFEEWIVAIRESAKCLKAESTFQGTAKLTGVFHDWGVLAGSQYTNHILEEGNDDLTPDQLILFDVLMPPHPETENKPVAPKETLREKVLALSYRIAFAGSFAIRKFLSKTLANVCLVISFRLLVLLGLFPIHAIDSKAVTDRKDPLSLDRVVYMTYPYYNIFKAMFAGNFKEVFSGCCLPLDLTKTPVLYMYGTHKRVNFHDKRAYKLLEREAKEGRRSKVVPVDDAGHWLYLQQPDVCFEEVKKFIEDA